MSKVAATKDRVQRLLTEWRGSIEIDEDGDFTFPYKSTRVFVSVEEWREASTVVIVTAYTNLNVPTTPDLYRYIAVGTDRYMFGHLGLHEKDGGLADVLVTHTLLGDQLDAEELRSAVGVVSIAADAVDDEIQKRFGGQRFIDL